MRVAKVVPSAARGVKCWKRRSAPASLAFKVMNLDADALDDVVGTYLADDELPLCAAG